MHGPADKPTHDEIASIAQAIWEREGRPEGRDHEHWLQARALLEAGRAAAEFPGLVAAREAGEPSQVIVPTPEVAPAGSGTPGPRNPEPFPATGADGYVAIPSNSDAAPAALRDDPVPPRGQSRPTRR